MWIVLFTLRFSGDIIPKADSGQRDETEIQGLQKVPIFLHSDKDPRRDEEEEGAHDDGEADGVNGGQFRLGHGPSPMEVRHWTPSYQVHEPLHHGGEEEEGDGDAEEGVEDTEGLPLVGERDRVTIT